MSFKFENLILWQTVADFALDVHELTNSFTKDGLLILSSQIKRAADSISLNTAVGPTGQPNPEFHKFLGDALGSNIEVAGYLYLAQKRN